MRKSSALINPPVTARSTGLYERALYLARQKSPQWTLVKELLEKAARKNDARAHYALATWFLHGFSPLQIQKSLTKAIRPLRVAARKKVPDALFDLEHFPS
jgi:TPR repeat protein